jgi:hypothetical protein
VNIKCPDVNQETFKKNQHFEKKIGKREYLRDGHRKLAIFSGKTY